MTEIATGNADPWPGEQFRQATASQLRALTEDIGFMFGGGDAGEFRDTAWSALPATEHDKWAEDFCWTLWLEGLTPGIGDLVGLPDQARRELPELFDTYYDALPFSSAERHWLTRELDPTEPVLTFGSEEGVSRVMAHMDQAESDILDAGVRKHVQGSELIMRWWDWRRGVGAFEGAGGYEMAHQALNRISELAEGYLSERQ